MAEGDELRKAAENILSGNMPTEMEQGMGAVHEIYLGLRESGFTERQALWIVGYIVCGGQNPPEDS